MFHIPDEYPCLLTTNSIQVVLAWQIGGVRVTDFHFVLVV